MTMSTVKYIILYGHYDLMSLSNYLLLTDILEFDEFKYSLQYLASFTHFKDRDKTIKY